MDGAGKIMRGSPSQRTGKLDWIPNELSRQIKENRRGLDSLVLLGWYLTTFSSCRTLRVYASTP